MSQEPSSSSSSSTTTTAEVEDHGKVEDITKALSDLETKDEDVIEGGLQDDFNATLDILQSDPSSPLYSAKSFQELGLTPELLQGVFAMKYNKPSKIQEAALPLILQKNENLIAQAQAGTGKTAAFALGMLSKSDPNLPYPQALCICPTRELAIQIFDVISKMGKYTKLTYLLAVGEMAPIKNKITSQIVVGTPGKVSDLILKNILDTKPLKVFVVDEADMLLEQQGGQDHTMRVRAKVPPKAQILLFSATFPDSVARFAERFAPKPVNQIRLKREDIGIGQVQQFYTNCTNEANKYLVLSDIYGYLEVGQSIIFVSTRQTAFNLHQRMTKDGHKCGVVYGGSGGNSRGGGDRESMTPAERDRVVESFRKGAIKVLIATNVLARGIDIPQVSMVVNYDLPINVKGAVDSPTYLHRIGRCGRFGRDGVAVTFVHDKESELLIKRVALEINREINELKPEEVEKLDAMLKGLNKAPARPVS
eukprot:TRINITY_DN5135_c0_g2_i1.p1 TRINITY_DN5135_c0_g2~~TRINITY_DN5135_c0_g2_i1.p1  ORF type:complete len:479 (-),score=65.93 TRINITY_DN5135_c0_g2_i1:66-1502(-)